MKTDFKLIGSEALVGKLERIDKNLDKAARESLLKQAEMVRDKIRDRAPLGLTGNLKRSPIAKMLPERPNYPLIAIAGIDRKIAPHAHLVEFGHAGPHPAPAHPFFRPAIEETMPKVYKELTEDLKDGVEKV